MTWSRHPLSDRALVHDTGRHQIVRYDSGPACTYELQELMDANSWHIPSRGTQYWHMVASEDARLADIDGRARAVGKLQGKVRKL